MLPELTVVNVFSWWLGWAGRSAVAVGAGFWLAYFGSLILQQAGPGFLTLWPQEAVPKAQVLESPPCSVDQSISRPAQTQEVGKLALPLDRRSCKILRPYLRQSSVMVSCMTES